MLRLINLQQIPQVSLKRTLFKPPSNVPFAGIYRKDGEICRQNDLLVVQRKMNYHPGANVRFEKDYNNQYHLMADCDGTVVITREKSIVDETNEFMQKEYQYRNFQGLNKLTFNVIPRSMSNSFKLE